MKKRVVTRLLAFSLAIGPLLSPIDVAADSLDDMQQEKNELENKQTHLQEDIEQSEKTMKSLSEEKASLENDVKALQLDIDDIVRKLKQQEDKLTEAQEKIKKLQSEIETLKKLIEQRREKLAEQARSVQTDVSTTDIVDMVFAAENLSDLVGRIGIVSQLVTANQDMVTQQANDKKSLEEKETLAQKEKATIEKLKSEIEINRNNLLAQKSELDDKIVKVAEHYQMTASEKNTFVEEQEVVAQQTSTLDANMKKEQERILAEERAREEKQRKAEEAAAKRAAEQEAAARKAQAAEETANTQNSSNRQKVDKQESGHSSQHTSSPAPSKKSVSSSGFIRPGGSYVTSHYGYRIHPITGQRKLHGGTDFGGGGTIVAAQSGTVVTAGYHSSWGYHVKINHGNGLQTLYAHMRPGSLTVVPGQKVSQGQQVGTMGTTGSSTGVHLHFEVYKNGSRVNPDPYLGI
ncbi:MAG: peptidoglycan DD-metalloendopeptidase family protein [Pisciglobus halotolerans]|nr:peptidoglycan DD-metalloendopeptidase family protein [Pisciglobus halotolerans]